MLYKQMQVKEIPIVFRGIVEGADIPTPIIPDPIINEELSSFEVNGNNDYDAIINTLIDDSAIWVKIGDQVYPNLPKTEIIPETIWAYGAVPDIEDGGIIDFSEYPFSMVCYPEMYPGLTQFTQQTNSPIEIEIWNSDPTPVSPLPIPGRKIFSAELTGNGQIKRFHARFACGENGTLHINPYVILNGNITVNLCDFAKEGENYISGDNEDFTFECYVPIETHAILYVEAENVGEYASMLDVAIVVQYEDFIEEETIVGYEGINLRRIHR